MPKHDPRPHSRRGLLKTSAALLGGAVLGARAKAAPEPPFQNVNTNSSPSTLKITDLRVATVRKPGPSPCTIIRLDTNQGVYGLGEVRDGASATYALFLKSRVVGENPLRITYIFEKIKQFGGHARQAGGVVAVEEALWDIAGKVYGVPIYQMLGGKFRDKVRIYADTEESEDVMEYAKRLKIRKEEMGLTWLKMDLGINMVANIPGTVTMPSGRDSLGAESVAASVHRRRGHRQGHREALRIRSGGARGRGHGDSALHGSPGPPRRAFHHPAGKGLREIQPLLDGGCDSLAIHRLVAAHHHGKPHPHPHRRRYLPEGRRSSICARSTR
jgi:hypothetical protein